jgi:hypothetical protein
LKHLHYIFKKLLQITLQSFEQQRQKRLYEPKFIVNLWELKPATQLRHGVVHTPRNVYFKDIRSALTPSLALLFTCIYIKKPADRYKCAQPIGEIFSTPPLSLCRGVDS